MSDFLRRVHSYLGSISGNIKTLTLLVIRELSTTSIIVFNVLSRVIKDHHTTFLFRNDTIRLTHVMHIAYLLFYLLTTVKYFSFCIGFLVENNSVTRTSSVFLVFRLFATGSQLFWVVFSFTHVSIHSVLATSLIYFISSERLEVSKFLTSLFFFDS